MNHVGQALKEAVEMSGHSTAEVARKLDVATSSLFRWYSIPNLPVKYLIQINEAVPSVNLSRAYRSIEKNTGERIPENPYSRESELIGNGIEIRIDVNEFAGMIIPDDLNERVKKMILDYQKGRKGIK